MKKKILFIDRDGTIIKEPPVDFQVDSLEKLEFVEGAIGALSKISKLDYYLAMVSNQDGLGTPSFPKETFYPAHNKMLATLKGEGFTFDAEHIDPSFEEECSPNRKPNIGMLEGYMNDQWDIENSFVIGDRVTDILLAKNIGCKAIFIKNKEDGERIIEENNLQEYVALTTPCWSKVYEFVRLGDRRAVVKRKTKETDITLMLDLDKNGEPKIETGLGFFDHMVEQIAYHASVDLELVCDGDLRVDEHHTVEDCAIALGEAFKITLGNKLGIARYGFALPMDDCQATVLIDFGGRSEVVWETTFKREKIGDTPTELFVHFFKSFALAAKCNIFVKAEGANEHHKIEGIFKAFARAIKMAKERNVNSLTLPSSKGIL